MDLKLREQDGRSTLVEASSPQKSSADVLDRGQEGARGAPAGADGDVDVDEGEPAHHQGLASEDADGRTANIGWVSRVLVLWLSPLLSLGYRRPIQRDDLPPLRPTYRGATLVSKLASSWKPYASPPPDPTHGKRGSEYALLRAALKAFGGPFYAAGVLKLVGDVCAIASPFVAMTIIKDLKAEAAGRLELWQGILLSLGIFILHMINTLTVNTYFTITMQTGLKLRTAVSGLIYQKALRLSGRARQSFSQGQIVNLMSTDAGRLELATSYLHYIWSGPFQVVVILVFLFYLVNWAAFVGFAFLLVGIPLQSRITTSLSKYRKETSMTTDKRVRLMQEVIQGIRVIKFYAWEPSFLAKIFELREAELRRIRKSQTIRSLTVVLTAVSSIFACIVTLIVHYLLVGELSAVVVFPTMMLFAQMRLPLVLLPMVVSMAVDGAVAAKRIQKFLQAEELAFFPSTDEQSQYGIIVEASCFTYETIPKATVDGASSPTTENKAKDSGPFVAAEPFKLRDLNLKIPRGALVAVVGPVGSGKSSLLSALVGELRVEEQGDVTAHGAEEEGASSASPEARVVFGGSVAYCPQQAWIQNATVRDNILFGLPYNETLYNQVVEACALWPDLLMLPDGDQTEIGEKGVNLSGGQKQRISLARATYARVDVVLLDDPLSAVDAHVGRSLWQRCLKGLMADRTRLLVTHQLHVLPETDLIIVMENGRASAVGPFSSLMLNNGAFAAMMQTHGRVRMPTASKTTETVIDETHDERQVELVETLMGPQPSVEDPMLGRESQAMAVVEEMTRNKTPVPTPTPILSSSSPSSPSSSSSSNTSAMPAITSQNTLVSTGPKAIPGTLNGDGKGGEKERGNKGRITAEEERVIGAVAWSVYQEYFVAAGGIAFVFLAAGSIIAWNGTRVLTDYWVSIWTDIGRHPLIGRLNRNSFIVIYVSLGLLQGLFAAISAFAVAWGALKASGTLHKASAERIIHSPVLFFDTNPTGRILNRFSKDVDTLDNLMPETIRSLMHTFGLTVFTFATIVAIKPVFLLPLLLLLVLYLQIQAYYRNSSRELKRLESLARSPLYAQFSETLTGLPTIRAFHQQSRFVACNVARLNTHNQAAFAQLAIQRWLGIRLESVGNLIILCVALSCYLFGILPYLAGLSLTYALSVTGVMNWCVRQFADTENQIISSERLGYYANAIPIEGQTTTRDEGLAQWRPSGGSIEFRNVTMQYRPDLPPVLCSLTLSIRAGERIGIVGRTGAGKSSVIMALFRIVEASPGGAVYIDGVDTTTIPLGQLRRNISIIPQDPVVFAGTVRWNLDPLGEHTDNDLWSALAVAHLNHAVARMDAGLDSSISEGGENLSVGQRQLLCLARAVLRRNSILVLDEATANIDLATDALIQRAIRSDFPGCTILTIAHRISTVIDYDRILVLEKGRVVEFDAPQVLLERPDSIFASLVREAGEQQESLLHPSLGA